MNKKIIGWIIKDKEFSIEKLREAIRVAYDKTEFKSDESLRGHFTHTSKEHPYSFANTSWASARLIEAGLLHQMFDPVYESARESGKLIGYKLPITIHSNCGPVHEGHLFVHDKTFPAYYIPKDFVNPDKYKIPREIVETWEAVYEKEFVDLVIQDQLIRVCKGKIIVENDNEIPFEDIMEVFEATFHFPKCISGTKKNYNIESPTIKIGCSYFTWKDIAHLVTNYKEFNNLK